MYPASHQDTEKEIIAHLTPSEARELAEMQGGWDFDHTRGLPTFKNLENVFFGRENAPKITEWIRSGYANGGEVDGINNYLRSVGRNGDITPVVLPRSVADLFDHALGISGKNANPRSDKREYWLGSLLGGIKNVLGAGLNTAKNLFSSASSAIPGVLDTGFNMSKFLMQHGLQGAGQALGNKVGNTVSNLTGNNELGNAIGNYSSGALGKVGDFLGKGIQSGVTNLTGNSDLGNIAGALSNTGFNTPNMGNDITNLVNKGIDTAGNAIASGVNSGLTNGGNYVGTKVGQALGSVTGNKEMGNNFGDVLSNGLSTAGSDIGNILSNYAKNGVSNYANTTLGKLLPDLGAFA